MSDVVWVVKLLKDGHQKARLPFSREDEARWHANHLVNGNGFVVELSKHVAGEGPARHIEVIKPSLSKVS